MVRKNKLERKRKKSRRGMYESSEGGEKERKFRKKSKSGNIALFRKV